MNNLKSLIDQGVLKFAKEPAGNPTSLDFLSYTIPLIEHDYPAKTPIMWNSAYEKFGMATRNIMMVANPENLPQIFSVMRGDPKYLGGGAGVGFKDASVVHLDSMDEIAEQIGAINFQIKLAGNKLKGYNTDGEGYAQSLDDLFALHEETLIGKKVVMLGSGGTANAIGFALAQRAVNLVILNRTVSVAQTLAEKINNFFGLAPKDKVLFGGEDAIASEVVSADVVLNVSTKGSAGPLEEYSALASAQLPVSRESIELNNEQAQKVLESIPRTTVISDILLTKKPTPLMQSAMDAGFTTLGGIPMVINQGVEAFWILHHEELIERGVSKEEVKEVMSQAATD